MSDIVTTGGGRGVLTVIPDNIFYVDATNVARGNPPEIGCYEYV